uniref:Uncharacterized protein n=1 Tax=Oryza punctata TaxID=4537 RepID=A0A0E0JFW3_ORYPU
MDSSDQRKGRKERRRLLQLIHGGWPSKRFGLKIYRRQFARRSTFLIRSGHGVWSQAHQRLIRMTRIGYWILYNLRINEIKPSYERLMRERGMARWPEYGAADREEVRSLIGKVKEEYWRRMPEHRRQKLVASLEEKRRLKEERRDQKRLAAAAAGVAASCCSAGGRG